MVRGAKQENDDELEFFKFIYDFKAGIGMIIAGIILNILVWCIGASSEIYIVAGVIFLVLLAAGVLEIRGSVRRFKSVLKDDDDSGVE